MMKEQLYKQENKIVGKELVNDSLETNKILIERDKTIIEVSGEQLKKGDIEKNLENTLERGR